MSAPNVLQMISPAAPSAATTSTSFTWGSATAVGSRLLIGVGFTNNSQPIVCTPPAGYTVVTPPTPAIRENPTGTPYEEVIFFEKLNAASESGAKTITFDHAVYPKVFALEIAGSSTTVTAEKSSSHTGASQTLDTGTTPATLTSESLLVGIISSANIDAHSSPTNSFVIAAQGNSGGTADPKKVNASLLTRTVTATGAYGTAVAVGGGFNHNFAGAIITIPAPSGGGGSSPGVGIGVAIRLAGYTSTVASRIARPDAKMHNCWLPLKNVHPVLGTIDWDTVLGASINDADTHAYKVGIRVVAGSSTPAWYYTDPTHPVAKIHLYTDASDSTGHDTPVPWDTNLVYWTNLVMDSLNTWLAGNNASGHPRKNYVVFLSAFMPADPGTEMWTLDETKDARNLGPWNSVSTGADDTAKRLDRRTKTQNAWGTHLTDIDTHCPNADPLLAGGAVFGDGQAYVLTLPAAKAASIPNLIVGETSGRPKGQASHIVTGTWAQYIPAAQQLILNAVANGLRIFMQSADWAIFDMFNVAPWNKNLAYEYTGRDMTGTLTPSDPGYPGYAYRLLFWEVNPTLYDSNTAYSVNYIQPLIAGGTNADSPVGTHISPSTVVADGPVDVLHRVEWTDTDGMGAVVSKLDSGAFVPMAREGAVGTPEYNNFIVLYPAVAVGSHTLVSKGTDQNASPNTTTLASFPFTVNAPAVTPPDPDPTPPPPPPPAEASTDSLTRFASYIYDDLAPIDTGV